MREHDGAYQFPRVRIGGALVPKLILGHLPFVGESYKGTEKNIEYYDKFSHVENTVKVLKKAILDYGVTAVASAPATEGKLHALLLDAIKEAGEATSHDIALIPCLRIPLKVDDKPVDDYRRWITYYDIESKIVGSKLLEKYSNDPILQCREGWKDKFPSALRTLRPYGGEEILKLKIDTDRIKKEIRSLQGFKILLAEPGSESDFLTMTGKLNLLEDFAGILRDGLNCPIVLATHHAGLTIPILEASEIRFDGYVTPVNKLGVMMLPTQELAFKAIRNARRPVIAIKPLAGGRMHPYEAFKYVYKELKADSCMVGVSSEEEAEEDLKAVKSILGGK